MPPVVYAKVAPEEKEEGEQLVTSELFEQRGPLSTSLRSSLCCITKDMCGIKAVILGSVVVQNTTYALVRRYSRGSLRETYSTSSVLLVMEIAKMLLSAVQVSLEHREMPPL
jgi:hypothetical protein